MYLFFSTSILTVSMLPLRVGGVLKLSDSKVSTFINTFYIKKKPCFFFYCT